MVRWIVLFVIAIIFGAVFLIRKTPFFKGRSREEFLKDMAEFLEGEVKPLEQYENSFVVSFKHKGRDFTFEDVEIEGLKIGEKSDKGFLKTKTTSQLTINFTERGRPSIKGEIVRASEISESHTEGLVVPKSLRDFSVYTNHAKMANYIFEDKELLAVFERYKYMDEKGRPVMPFFIQDGTVGVQFKRSIMEQPSLNELNSNLTSIEVHLNRVALIAEEVDRLDKALHEK